MQDSSYFLFSYYIYVLFQNKLFHSLMSDSDSEGGNDAASVSGGSGSDHYSDSDDAEEAQPGYGLVPPDYQQHGDNILLQQCQEHDTDYNTDCRYSNVATNLVC